jgi:transposase
LEDAQSPLIRSYSGTGRIPYQYQPFVRSVLATCFFKIDTTTQFIQRLQADSNLRLLCGFEKVPGKSTFSRNFAVLSETAMMSETLDRLVKEAHTGQAVYHVSRDSTAIEAREKPHKKPKKRERQDQKRCGRPKKGEIRLAKAETVIAKQVHESVEDALKNIDTACAHGCKKNSRGAARFWTGYKLHLDVSDTGFPLSAFVSGANVHDSQLTIPLERMTESKALFCYSLMDAAYDCSVIDDFIRSRERVPIIVLAVHYETTRYAGTLNQMPLAPYCAAHVTCNQNLGKNFTAFASLRNILNAHYESFAGYYMPGISLTAGLRVKFGS